MKARAAGRPGRTCTTKFGFTTRRLIPGVTSALRLLAARQPIRTFAPSVPQGLKPLKDLRCHVARLKPCPDGIPYDLALSFLILLGCGIGKSCGTGSRCAEHFGSDLERETDPFVLVGDFGLSEKRCQEGSLLPGHLAAHLGVV